MATYAELGSRYRAPRAETAERCGRAGRGLALSLVILCKPRIVGLVLITGLVSMIAANGALSLVSVALFLSACTAAAAGAAALNHYLDRDIDGLMERTRSRPIPSGAIAPRTAGLVGLGLLMLAQPPLLALGRAVVGWALAAVVFYVVVYSVLLKRRTSWNVVIGGWTGSCVVLAGWEAAGVPLTPGAWALAGVVFVWTPAHFWGLGIQRVEEYRRAGVPMLPVVHGVSYTARAILLGGVLAAALSIVPWAVGEAGLVYGLAALAGAGLFVLQCARLVRAPSGSRAFSTYKLSGIYLALVFVALAVDRLLAVGLR